MTAVTNEREEPAMNLRVELLAIIVDAAAALHALDDENEGKVRDAVTALEARATDALRQVQDW